MVHDRAGRQVHFIIDRNPSVDDFIFFSDKMKEKKILLLKALRVW